MARAARSCFTVALSGRFLPNVTPTGIARARPARSIASGAMTRADRHSHVEGVTGAGNLSALCEASGTMMHRRARREALDAVMPGLDVTIREAPPR